MKTPEIRFQDFSEPWKEAKLGDCLERCIKSSNSDNKIGLENISQGSGRFIETATSFLTNGTAFAEGNIIYGKLRPNLRKVWLATFAGSAVGDCFVFKTKDGCDAELLKNIMLSESFTHKMVDSMSGTKMPRVPLNEIINYKVLLPSLAEQRLIGTYFRSLDTAIRQSELRAEALSRVRASMLARMFPADGSTTPEIRFQGFSEPWHEVKLEDVMTKCRISQFSKISKNDIQTTGKYPVVTQEKDELISGYTNNEHTITDIPVILFGDHSCAFKYIDFEFVRGADGTQLIKPQQALVDTRFLFYELQNIPILNSDNYERHFKYVKSAPILLPTLAEQRLIGTCFRSLDTAIRQSELRAEALSRVRASMLARMFPNNQ